MYTLSEIWIYPIKSLGGIRLTSSKVVTKGLEFDRRFMLVNEFGVAMTQREYPIMSLFNCSIDDKSLVIKFNDDILRLPTIPSSDGAAFKTKVWDDTVETFEVDPLYSTWFSEKLGASARLVFFPEDKARAVDTAYAKNNENVSLADSFPVLIIGQESLNDLNARLNEPVPMNRFRPNFVFSGGSSFDEDTWLNFTIGSNKFSALKPCSRCVLTTVNQETGLKGIEPLKTLASYRTRNNKVYFGQNVLVLHGTEVHEGDIINVQSYK